jgi:hypothetical protein
MMDSLHPCFSDLRTNSLGNLISIISVLGLHALDQLDVSLLRLVACDALIDDILPCALLCFALVITNTSAKIRHLKSDLNHF